jgi:heptosyltransferase I
MLNGVPRILIVRFSAIGDVVRVLPALHALRVSFPNAQIDWVVEPKSVAVVEGHPDLDTVVVFERPKEVKRGLGAYLRLCREIRESRYDIVIDFHGIFKSGLLTGLSGAPERYGFSRPRAREGSWLFYNRRHPLHTQDLNRVHENILLCKELAPKASAIEALIAVSEDVQESVDAYFDETFQGGKQVVLVHAPVDRQEKRWPDEYFAETIDLLLGDGRYEVLMTWGPGQFTEVESIIRRCRRNPMVAPETPDLKHFAWLVQRSDVFFGGDTGPMHIAWAMGTAVVAVFGGTNPEKHEPVRRPYEILYAGGKGTSAERLRRITPEMAYDAIVRVTAGQPPST